MKALFLASGMACLALGFASAQKAPNDKMHATPLQPVAAGDAQVKFFDEKVRPRSRSELL